MKPLLIATNNQHKYIEMTQILAPLPFRFLSANDIGLDVDVTEDGLSYLENARKKALAFFHASGLPTLADDSGLEVAALQGAPGILSHRYAPKPNATDADRCAYLLSRLAPHPKPWVAAFHCEVVLYTGVGTAYNAHGICPGFIIEEPRGDNGFGYDPIFVLEGATQTMAELDNVTKNTLSHRARALQTAMPFLSDFANS